MVFCWLLILISLVVAVVFGWDFMVSGWEYVFETTIRLVEAIITRIEGSP